MLHLLEHINQDIKRDKAKIRTQQYIKLNTRAREIQQVNPRGPDNSRNIRPLPSSSPTHGHAIKEESKVEDRDWVDYQACNLLQYINVIANLLKMGNYFNELPNATNQVNVACSNQTRFVYVWDKRYIYLYTLVYVTKFVRKFNGIKLVLAVTYHSYHLARIRLKGYSSQKSIDFLLNPFCIKLVTIHFSACNFAIVYLYKEIKFKLSPKANGLLVPGMKIFKGCLPYMGLMAILVM